MAKKRQTDPKKLAAELAETGRAFHVRGWALGTSGNYSAVLKDKPLRLLITSSGVDKAQLNKRHFLEIDDRANILRGDGRPSAESLLHVAVGRARGAGCGRATARGDASAGRCPAAIRTRFPVGWATRRGF